jgi:hypothetical protein
LDRRDKPGDDEKEMPVSKQKRNLPVESVLGIVRGHD